MKRCPGCPLHFPPEEDAMRTAGGWEPPSLRPPRMLGVMIVVLLLAGLIGVFT